MATIWPELVYEGAAGLHELGYELVKLSRHEGSMASSSEARAHLADAAGRLDETAAGPPEAPQPNHAAAHPLPARPHASVGPCLAEAPRTVVRPRETATVTFF